MNLQEFIIENADRDLLSNTTLKYDNVTLSVKNFKKPYGHGEEIRVVEVKLELKCIDLCFVKEYEPIISLNPKSLILHDCSEGYLVGFYYWLKQEFFPEIKDKLAEKYQSEVVV